uniref:YLPM1-like spectrin repeat domain-containing protein n=1 Tax=Acrobeloides nanus TaxID=290746 RepID=A0A914CEG9_9BILA
MSKKLAPEEELEKQYRDYKAQFEQWKEKNKGSVGTEAYNNYVKQFESWEKDVEKRRAQVRHKAEVERKEAEKAAAEREEQERRRRDEEAAASAYAEQQRQYISMHQEAIETKVSRQAVPIQQTAAHAPEADISNMYNVMQQMISFASATMGVDQKPNGDITHQRQATTAQYAQQTTIQAEPQPAAAQQPQQPLQLWGNEGAPYGPDDPMFRKWNVRAAPPNFKIPYQPPPQKTPITPCWYLIQKMNENRLMFASHRNVPPPPVPPNFATMPPPRPEMNPTVVPSMNLPHPTAVPNMNVPPPTGIPPMNVPPPTTVSMSVPPPSTGGVPPMNVPPPNVVPPMNVPPPNPAVQPLA